MFRCFNKVIGLAVLTVTAALATGSLSREATPIPKDVDWGPKVGMAEKGYLKSKNNFVSIPQPVHVIARGKGCKSLVIVTEFHHPGSIGYALRGAKESRPLQNMRVSDRYLESKGIPKTYAGCRRPILARLVNLEAGLVWYFINNDRVGKAKFDAAVGEIARFAGVSASVTKSPKAPPNVADRLNVRKDPVSQFVDYAAALGIEEAQITSAIFGGRFVPDVDDLRLVMRTLWGKTCSEDFRSLLSDRRVLPGQIQSYDCLMRATNAETASKVWNARFGAPPDTELFLLATRLSFMLTGRDGRWTDMEPEKGMTKRSAKTVMSMLRDRAAPYYFHWIDESNPRSNFKERYEQMRISYLSTLPSQVSQEALSEIGLVGDEQAIDVLDQIPDVGVLKVYATGDRERIFWHQAAKMAKSSNQNWVREARDQVSRMKAPFTTNMAAWALARIGEIGPCDDRIVEMVSSSTPITDHYKGGLFQERTVGTASETKFTALAAFSEILIAAPLDTSIKFEDYRQAARFMGCNNPIRAGVEANMVALFKGEPLPFNSGL